MSILPMRKLTASQRAACNGTLPVPRQQQQRCYVQQHQVAISAGLMALVPYFDTALTTAIIAVLLAVLLLLLLLQLWLLLLLL